MHVTDPAALGDLDVAAGDHVGDVAPYSLGKQLLVSRQRHGGGVGRNTLEVIVAELREQRDRTERGDVDHTVSRYW
jgi:hypothetical protein